ncbi:MAG: glycosyltransferase family 4 protein [Thermodesulfobacteriota bacterium]
MNRSRALFLLEGESTPSSRLRVLNFLPYLDPDRFDVEVAPIPNSVLSRPRLFRASARADLVFIQKKLFRLWELPFLRGRKALVYDFDDMVMLPGRDKNDPRQPAGGGRQRRFERTLAAADLVIAGSEFLKSQTGAASGKTLVIPTTVDTSAQPVKKHEAGQEDIILGWIGTKGNLRYLNLITGSFRRLIERGYKVILKIVADGFMSWPGIRTIEKPWRLADEASDLTGFDIGLMPLSDDPWSRGKCGYKLIQYMAAGLPVVASPVGANKEIVQDGRNGFLAAAEDDWVDRLAKLMDSVELRRELGLAGRRTVERSYDSKTRAKDFTRSLEKALLAERRAR